MRDLFGLVRPASIFKLTFALISAGCSHPVNYEHMPVSSSSAEMSGANNNNSSTERVILNTEETFFPGVKVKKKIDILMLVDNSGSMGDDQAALAAGFSAIANNYFKNRDFDICIAIITSDRYLGRTGQNGYLRERSVGCTNPDGSENWTEEQLNMHWDALIADFKTKVNVGTSGSPRELVGKSLATYLFDQNAWSSNLDTGTLNSFFRTDAVANVSVFTDENNYYYNNLDPGEALNDIPHLMGNAIPGGGGTLDTRKGIKEYLDDYFTRLASISTDQLNYSVLAMLQLTKLIDRSANMYALVDAIGRNSLRAEISGDAKVYESVYDGLIQELIFQANAIKLAHAYYEPDLPGALSSAFKVVLNSTTELVYGTDFTLAEPNQVRLSKEIAAALVPTDKVVVQYQYLK